MSGSAGTQRTARKLPPSILLGPAAAAELNGDLSKGFHERHQYRRFVMDFSSAKEAVVKYDELNIVWRVLEELKLNGWATARDYYSDENGRPLTKSDIARKLGVATQRVDEAIELLEKLRLVRIEKRIIFLIDDPKGEETENDFPDGMGNRPPKTSRKEMAKAEKFWAQHNPDRFQQYQKAGKDAREKEEEFRHALDRRRELRDEMLEAFRAAQPKPADDTAAESNEDFPTRPGNETGSDFPPRAGNQESDFPTRPGNFPDPSGNEASVSFMGLKAKSKLASAAAEESQLLEQEIRERVRQSDLEKVGGVGLDAQTVRNLRTSIEHWPRERWKQILEVLEDRCRYLQRRPAEAKTKTWGWVVSAVRREAAKLLGKGVGRAAESAAAEDVPAETLEQQIAQLEERISVHEHHPQIGEWEAALEVLRKTHRAEMKAQKAGQA